MLSSPFAAKFSVAHVMAIRAITCVCQFNATSARDNADGGECKTYPLLAIQTDGLIWLTMTLSAIRLKFDQTLIRESAYDGRWRRSVGS